MILGTQSWAESAGSRLGVEHVGKGGEHLLGEEERKEDPVACLGICHPSPSHPDQEVTFFKRTKTVPTQTKEVLAQSEAASTQLMFRRAAPVYASLRSCPSYREYARVDKTTGEERPNQFLSEDVDSHNEVKMEEEEGNREEDAGKLLDHWLGELNSFGKVKIMLKTYWFFRRV